MSFLGDLVNSIGTNKAPVLPKAPAPPPPRPPITSSAAHSNPAPRPKSVPNPAPPPVAGLKRKLDERDTKIIKPAERSIKPNPAPGLSSKVSQKPVSQVSNGVTHSAPKIPIKAVPVKAESTTAVSSSKPPPSKGSYAQIMARAKEAQETRTQNPLGTIKHQATVKEKASKLAERRRQEQEKLKSDKEKKSGKPTAKDKPERKRGASPIKKSDQPKALRAPRPPLHAPASSYKGTMGISAKKPRDERVPRKGRYDEYLGTDEEDNSEMDDYGDDDDGYGYGSDASSDDMEAGLDDIDMEESNALRLAKEDDAKELALENQLKREKEERKRRLQAMARKGR